MSDLSVKFERIIKSFGAILTIVLIIAPLGIPILLIYSAITAWKKSHKSS